MQDLVNTILLVKAESKEWDYMWDELAKHKSNHELPAPVVAENFGEVWQYMETLEVSSLWSGKHHIHCFRHRLHPVKGDDYRLKIPASRDFNPDEMQFSFHP